MWLRIPCSVLKRSDSLPSGTRTFARERQTPNPADFSGVLTSGAFSSQGRRVVGHWPIERSFVQYVLGGGA